ncbi:MAG: alpha/beta hydrolase-fold protein [Proteobacteria bacterium]|nr:alpha/beta hydrolase-fold protein [Pseudomonadota bacterium]
MNSIWQIPHSSGCKIFGWDQPSPILAQSTRRFGSVRPHRAFVPPHPEGIRLPVLYCLSPWTHSGRSMVQWEAFKEDLPSRLMRLIKAQTIPACVVIFPDMFTDFGGSQYIDSDCVGKHASHIVHELIPFVEEHFPVIPGWSHRGVFGRSSGGFGAIRFAMDFPQVFAAIGCHAGDMGFDWVYRRSLIDLCTGLAKHQTPCRLLDYLKLQKKLSGWDINVLMLLGMCAFYSPNQDSESGFDLPLDINSGEISEAVYQRWTANDPVELVSQQKAQDALGELSTLFIDCGNKDQFFLQYGSRRFSKRLKDVGIKHVYQEFDDNHSGTNYRFDESLPRLLSALV